MDRRDGAAQKLEYNHHAKNPFPRRPGVMTMSMKSAGWKSKKAAMMPASHMDEFTEHYPSMCR